LPPSLAMLILVAVYDRVSGSREQVSAQQK
jgi:LIVCS family branched-chain amino acid:cation transporter